MVKTEEAFVVISAGAHIHNRTTKAFRTEAFVPSFNQSRKTPKKHSRRPVPPRLSLWSRCKLLSCVISVRQIRCGFILALSVPKHDPPLLYVRNAVRLIPPTWRPATATRGDL
jgi:hypothetical protein